MKILILNLLFFVCSATMLSQENDEEQTLFGGENISIGFYGAPDIKFSQFNREFGVLVGGRGGIIFNGIFSIGGGGSHNVTNHKIQIIQDNTEINSYLNVDYGGFFFEYINSTNKPIHYTINTLIGWGNADYDGYSSFGFNNNEKNYESSGFFVFEPGITMEMNMTKYLRVGIGASYRIISGLDLSKTSNSDLNGFSVNIICKFGFFKKFEIPEDIKEVIEDFND